MPVRFRTNKPQAKTLAAQAYYDDHRDKTVVEIAEMFGISTATALKIRRRLGIPDPPRGNNRGGKYSAARIAATAFLKKNPHLTNLEVGKRFGLNHMTVSRIRTDEGIPHLPKGGLWEKDTTPAALVDRFGCYLSDTDLARITGVSVKVIEKIRQTLPSKPRPTKDAPPRRKGS